MLSAKIHLQSVRIQRQGKIPAYHYWSIMMDELVDLDEEKSTDLDMLIRKNDLVAKAYNNKAKLKVFLVGDYV